MGYYTLRANDSIYRLAVWFYYNYTLWPLIYYTNENIIGDNPFILTPGKKIFIPKARSGEATHKASQDDNGQSLSLRYYGIDYYHLRIDAYNNYPIRYEEGFIYKIPPLTPKIELDAAKELREKIHVEFDRSN